MMSVGAGTVVVAIGPVAVGASEPASIVNCQASPGARGIGADTATMPIGVWAVVASSA
jgi:hypothetical protein